MGGCSHTFSLLQLVACLSFARLVVTGVAADSAANGPDVGQYCCRFLSFALGSKVAFPSTTAYNASIGSYWSQQAEALTPSCVFSPTSAQDVSEAVVILTGLSAIGSRYDLGCQFAIRSGGHTPWAGASSINGGVTIDMSSINQVTVSADESYTSVGPGNRWVDVYLKLDALGLAVLGGRVSTVGVGGLVTGGGISFFSPRYGFVCDAVQAFQVVLADGRIVEATAKEYSDLFYALKGGSNNFGVVTRIDLKTFAQGKFWGGFIGYTIQTLSQQIQAFVDFTAQPSYDIYSALINSYAFTAASGWFVANNFQYTRPTAYPPAFQEYTSIQPQFFNTMRISNLSDFTIELNGRSPNANRQLFYTATYANDYTVLYQLFQQCNSSLQPVVGVAGLSWSLSLQPIVPAIMKFSGQTGGNALGLDPSQGSQALALLAVTWTNPADDMAVTNAALDMFNKANAYAAASAKLRRFVYLNYAYKTQKPISGYGSVNAQKLLAVSQKYDPLGIFQTQVPGGFKLAMS